MADPSDDNMAFGAFITSDQDILEGQFYKKVGFYKSTYYMHGYGRHFNKGRYEIGHFKHGFLDGMGVRIDRDGNEERGVFERG